MSTDTTVTNETDNFPLVDDESQGSSIDTGGRIPRPAQPLPRDESDDQEEKARLISQVLELQNTLDDLSQRVDSVKEESLKLRSENQVLGQYIQNLMASSAVFQPAQSKAPQTKNEMFGAFFW
ncbi:short coiled-coil protein, putative [Brugia malayi]|uniref:BMA-UNC-69, isoform e n=1 Tax=Brugia malayi TaxID=6279 RepID=A0A1P6C551_BRUMA|nr:short coiled-coil protein, putative [Brugia malayi]CDP93424.1 BMA-UNC-69, isoform e [Brugia malayi]VIO90316.1 short coiled-coil protein, putative [Brugia malayi]